MFKIEVKNGRVIKFNVVNEATGQWDLIKKIGGIYNKEIKKGAHVGYNFDLLDGEYLMKCKVCMIGRFVGCKLYTVAA